MEREMNSANSLLLIVAMLLAACGDEEKTEGAPRPVADPPTSSADSPAAPEGFPASPEDLTVPAYERPSAAAAASEHGEEREIGLLTIAGNEYRVVLFGQLKPGEMGAFDVHVADVTLEDPVDLETFLWVESDDGTQLSAPSEGSIGLAEEEAGTAATSAESAVRTMHFHVTPKKGDKIASRVVLRVRSGDSDERASLPL